MAKYASLGGHPCAGLPLATQAFRLVERHDNGTELYLRLHDHGQLLLDAGRPAEALNTLPDPDTRYSPPERASTTLLLVEALQRVGRESEAHDWLQRALELVEANGLDPLRPKADALAETM